MLVVAAGAETLRLPNIFGDHMVLQCELPVVVWGWAEEGEKVTVSFGTQSKSTKADSDGRWRVRLKPLETSAKAAVLKVQAGDEVVGFNDVLVGEVWLCSGQSNMEWRLSGSDGAETAIANADSSLIRHIEMDHIMRPEPVDDVESKKGWEVSTPETVGSWTAVGYFFSKELHENLDVPVGLINSSWGGSNIMPFTPLEGFKLVPELSETVGHIEASLPGNPAYERSIREAMAQTRTWLKETKQALEDDTRVAFPPSLPKSAIALQNWPDPTNKYNAMLHGLVPYRIRGSIWYQGESDRNDGMLYVHKTRAQVEGWRKIWGQPDLPYCYVQIAPYQYGNEDPEILPRFWEAQAAIEKEIPNTGMVVIHDVGNLKDIHPTNKITVGKRLASLALAKTYGKDVLTGGPQFDKMTIEDGKLRVLFRRTGSGLVTSDDKSPDWFEIAGDNGLFVPADARIDGKTVVLSSKDVKKPAAMRYGWHKLAEPNLRSKEGLPVSPFRAGEINERALLDATVPQAKEHELVYSYDIGSAGTTKSQAVYRLDRADKIKSFDRVAYFLALKKAREPVKYVWVSMDPFAKQAAKLGVPTSSVNVTHKQWVDNMNVQTNVDGLKTGQGLKGYIEFWPNNYGPQNTAAVEGASDDVFDFGDTPPRQSGRGLWFYAGAQSVRKTNDIRREQLVQRTKSRCRHWQQPPGQPRLHVSRQCRGISTQTPDGPRAAGEVRRLVRRAYPKLKHL